MINCENCRRYKKSCTGGLAKEQCEKIKLPLTNADRIRSMTDEELAKFIASGIPTDVCKDRCGGDESFQCSECVLDWLKQEAQCTSE